MVASSKKLTNISEGLLIDSLNMSTIESRGLCPVEVKRKFGICYRPHVFNCQKNCVRVKLLQLHCGKLLRL